MNSVFNPAAQRAAPPSKARLPKLIPWLVVALLLVMTAASLPRLSSSIWSDEWWTLYYIGATDPDALPTIPATLGRVAGEGHELNPPGYYVLLVLWANWVGSSELALRWFSVLAGGVAVAWTYRLGTDLADRETGLYAAVMVGANAFTINYLHDMRMYSLMLMWAAAVPWAYWRAVHTGRAVYLAGLGAACLGLLYTHYFAALLLVPLGVYHLWRGRGRCFWPVAAVVIVAGLLLLPWFHLTLASLDTARDSIRSVVDRYTVAETLRHLMYTATNGNALLGWGLLALGVWWRRGQGWAFALLVLGGGLAAILLANIPVPILTEKRYLLYLFPALAVVMASGLGGLRARAPLAGGGVMLLWVAAALYNNADPTAQQKIHIADWHPPLKPLAATLAGYTAPGDVVLFHLPEGSMRSNVPRLMDYYGAQAGFDGVLIPAGQATLDATYRGYVRAAAADTSNLWVTYEPERRTYRLGMIEEVVLPEMGFAACGVLADQQPTYAAFYARSPDAADFTMDTINFYRLNTLPVIERDGQLATAFGWDAGPETPPHTYSVAVHLWDENGAVVQQTDYALTTEGFGCAWRALPVRGVAPGDYRLVVQVYNWQTGEVLGEYIAGAITLGG